MDTLTKSRKIIKTNDSKALSLGEVFILQTGKSIIARTQSWKCCKCKTENYNDKWKCSWCGHERCNSCKDLLG